MRVALAASALTHTVGIVLTLVVLPRTAPAPVELPPVLPVELLTIAEETNIAPAVEEVAEEVKEPETPPEPEEKDEPVPPAPVEEKDAPESKAPPKLQRVEEAPAPPAEKPKPVEAKKPEPAPAPVAEALKPVEPEEEPEDTPTEKLAEARPAEKPKKPFEAPKKEEPKVKKAEDDFFTDLSSALVDKSAQPEQAREFHKRSENAQDSNDRQRAAAGLQTALTVSEVDTIRAQLQPCWYTIVGAPQSEDLIVVLRVNFNSDGTVRGNPEVVEPSRYPGNGYAQAAVNRAVSAVLQCQPFNLPADRYSAWKTVTLDFDPRFLLGL